jgi:hypothetical protein
MSDATFYKWRAAYVGRMQRTSMRTVIKYRHFAETALETRRSLGPVGGADKLCVIARMRKRLEDTTLSEYKLREGSFLGRFKIGCILRPVLHDPEEPQRLCAVGPE